jgi:hypothetical protein
LKRAIGRVLALTVRVAFPKNAQASMGLPL